MIELTNWHWNALYVLSPMLIFGWYITFKNIIAMFEDI